MPPTSTDHCGRHTRAKPPAHSQPQASRAFSEEQREGMWARVEKRKSVIQKHKERMEEQLQELRPRQDSSSQRLSAGTVRHKEGYIVRPPVESSKKFEHSFFKHPGFILHAYVAHRNWIIPQKTPDLSRFYGLLDRPWSSVQPTNVQWLCSGWSIIVNLLTSQYIRHQGWSMYCAVHCCCFGRQSDNSDPALLLLKNLQMSSFLHDPFHLDDIPTPLRLSSLKLQFLPWLSSSPESLQLLSLCVFSLQFFSVWKCPKHFFFSRLNFYF